MGWSACSGKSRRRRTGADDLGRPTTKMTAMAAPRGTPACVARRGGSWRRGGAPGHDGEARGRRWLWPQRAVATAALRARGEGEMQGMERNERARERSGAMLALLARPGRRGGGHAGSCRGAHARGVRRPRALSLWREEGDDWRRPVSWAELLGRSGKWPR